MIEQQNKQPLKQPSEQAEPLQPVQQNAVDVVINVQYSLKNAAAELSDAITQIDDLSKIGAGQGLEITKEIEQAARHLNDARKLANILSAELLGGAL